MKRKVKSKKNQHRFTLYRDHPWPRKIAIQRVAVPKGSYIGFKFYDKEGLIETPLQWDGAKARQEWISPLEYQLHAIHDFVLARLDGKPLITKEDNHEP